MPSFFSEHPKQKNLAKRGNRSFLGVVFLRSVADINVSNGNLNTTRKGNDNNYNRDNYARINHIDLQQRADRRLDCYLGETISATALTKVHQHLISTTYH